MNFLCIAIDLKQSVESVLKLKGKSSATVLDEVQFIVNLCSFPQTLVPQKNPFFTKVSHLTPTSRTTSKFSPSFSVNPSFLNKQNRKQS